MIRGYFNKKERFILCVNVLFDSEPLTTLLSSVSRNPSVNYETLWTHNYIIKFEFRTDIYTLNSLIHALHSVDGLWWTITNTNTPNPIYRSSHFISSRVLQILKDWMTISMQSEYHMRVSFSVIDANDLGKGLQETEPTLIRHTLRYQKLSVNKKLLTCCPWLFRF